MSERPLSEAAAMRALGALVFAVALLGLSSCDQDETCRLTCERWVEECFRWDWDGCWDDCMNDGYSRTYADCIQDAPCPMLNEVCAP